ncbi:uncharacterized protein loaf [Calliphora vicina]|uniref:uncharacterized protein loaf n=1 Tax=Calliphora vicina TaxID=7373 RepID=UPI00325BC039
MLQPTSCGPGPPDKTFEFNNNNKNEMKQKRKNEQLKQEQETVVVKLEKRNNNINENYQSIEKRMVVDNDDEDDYDNDNDYVYAGSIVNDDDYEKRMKSNERQQKPTIKFNTNNSNNNNNCHLKNIKLYLNKTTAITKTPTTIAIQNKNSVFSRASSDSNNQAHPSILAATARKPTKFVTPTSNNTNSNTTTATSTTCSSTRYTRTDAAAATATSQQPITVATVAVANVANNLNKFYCNFTTSTTTSTSATATTTTTTTSIKWILMFLMLFNILAQTPHQVAAEKSKHYYMQSLCKNHFLQQLYRKIDGAVLWSQNERNLDCIITFQTHSILQRFMLRFDMLQLDCNDHLYVYDGAHAVATPKIDISCRQTKQTVSSILTRTNFVTLKYVTDNWGTDANGFKLVITSVKDPKHTCKDFTCGSNGFCIHPDLLCDGINHCSDNSDESVHNLCQSETSSTVFGMDMTWFVMIVVSILLILSAAIVGITICVCRRQEETNNQQNTAIQLHHNLAETNGSSKHLHYTHGGTLTREHTQLPPTSGNWHHPAGPYTGYHRMQRNYLKMATKVRPILCLANFVN